MKFGDKIYYSDELNDEVVDFQINQKPIDENYQYERKGFFYRLWSFITYRLLLIPIISVYKLFCGVHIKNKKVLKTVKTSFFLYGNHTNQLWDGFTPTFVCHPRQPYLIVNADNVSMPFWKHFTKMWGALPLPGTFQAAKNFMHAMDHKVEKKNPIVIYPEEHLWPYYTKIRPFSDKSFGYPVKYNLPVFTMTTTYHQRKFSKKPRMDIYVDGPFYVDENLDTKAAQKKLCDQAYQVMCERAKLSDYEFVVYEKRSQND